MKKITKLLFLFAVFLFGLTACSKEKKIERSLLKKDGVWDVVNYHRLTYSDTDSLIDEEIDTDFAIFNFYKDGSFKWQINSDSPAGYDGTWLNTDDEIVIALDQFSYHGPNVFKIINKSKNEMTLESITRFPDIATYKHVETYQIKRRN